MVNAFLVTTSSLKDFGCVFWLCPRGSRKELEDFISCQISLMGNPAIKFDCYELEVIGASGKTLKKYECNYPITAELTLISADCISMKEVVRDTESSVEDSLTFCIKLHQENSTGNESYRRVASTKLGVDRHFLDFEVRLKEPSKVIIKCFQIYISASLNNLEVTVTRLDGGRESRFVDFNLSMLTFKSHEKYSHRAKHLFTSSGLPEWKFPSTRLSTELKNNHSKYISPNYFYKFITLSCEFSYSNGINLSTKIPETPSSDPITSPASLNIKKKKKKKRKKKSHIPSELPNTTD